jgi:hypothetical protein
MWWYACLITPGLGGFDSVYIRDSTMKHILKMLNPLSFMASYNFMPSLREASASCNPQNGFKLNVVLC